MILIDGFFCVRGEDIAETSAERRSIHDQCIAHVYSLLLKYETTAVNDAVLQIFDTFENQKAHKIWKKFRRIVIPPDQLIHADSMLMSRAANVCVPFTWYGRCDYAGQSRRVCSGRHICIIPECRQKHNHATPFLPFASDICIQPMPWCLHSASTARYQLRHGQRTRSRQSTNERQKAQQQETRQSPEKGPKYSAHPKGSGKSPQNAAGPPRRYAKLTKWHQRTSDIRFFDCIVLVCFAFVTNTIGGLTLCFDLILLTIP